MARDDTRLHRLEAMVAGLLAWQNMAEKRVAALEQRVVEIAGYGCLDPAERAAAPAQAAQPAPEPLKGPCPWCHRKSWSWTGNFWMCGICGGVLKPPAKAQPAPHPLEADLDSPDFDKFCAEVRGKPAPQQPLGPGLAELGACKHVWQHEAMAVDGDYYRCPLCNAHKMERRQPRGGGG